MKKPNIIIATLTLSALILGSLLLGSWCGTAYGHAGAVSKGDYTMVPGAWALGNDFVYVIDAAEGRLIVYLPNRQNRTIDLVDAVDMAKVFNAD